MVEVVVGNEYSADGKRWIRLIKEASPMMQSLLLNWAKYSRPSVTSFGICSICREEQIGKYHEHPCE